MRVACKSASLLWRQQTYLGEALVAALESARVGSFFVVNSVVFVQSAVLREPLTSLFAKLQVIVKMLFRNSYVR